MSYRPEVFEVQFPLVKDFIYHLFYYRTLFSAYPAPDTESEFWAFTINAHLFQAIHSWCMVFGADSNNPTHWKELKKPRCDDFENTFRQGLLSYTNSTRQDWDDTWKYMTNFRNKYSAHWELKIQVPVPELDYARKVAFFYDQWIRQVIEPDIFEELALEDSYKELVTSWESQIKQLLQNWPLKNKINIGYLMGTDSSQRG